MRSVWAMVCGTVRDQVDFSLMMDYLLQCREQGIIQGIVVSTWVHEFDELSDLQMKLAMNNVEVIMSPTNDQLVGDMGANSVNYWRQAKQMQAALDVIPTDAIVLKTRTDRALPATRKLIAMLDEADALPSVAEQAEERQLTGIPQVFDHQIAIFKARTGRLLQFTDFAFMGYSKDIRKLINFDIADFAFTRSIVANIQFFIYPFIRDYPVIRDYYRVIDFYPLLKDLAHYTENGGTQFPKFLERVYAAYFGLLALHFRIGTLGDPERLGEVTMPIEFPDLFHSGQHRHLVHDALGVTLNSQAVLDQFMKQADSLDEEQPTKRWWQRKQDVAEEQPTVQLESTKQVLYGIKHLSADMLDRVTEPELNELKVFAENKDFSTHHWLRISRATLTEQPQAYQQSVRYELPGISKAEQVALWEKCEDSENPSRELYRYWQHHDIQPRDTPAYLLNSARTDNRFSILTLSRLLRQGVLNEKTAAEALRINNFFASFHVRHGQMNAETACYVLARYLYLVENGLKIPAMATEQTKYVFKRYLPGKFDTFKSLVTQPEKMVVFFDEAIAARQGKGQTAARQRVLEMALEVTHEHKYWSLLEPMFNGKYKGYEYAYQYGIKWELL
ncbi:hypothetical protein ACFQ44_09625 [Levilactobacillus lanxiensis]|uniref:CRISPR-associated protein n=1 Tax=Levilactobacillus lanxiensis TaxID=2799568 RepID=A0ABW4D7K4_9LACO|nr:hypothetical protein [Levilactobacillus lanxiensis]